MSAVLAAASVGDQLSIIAATGSLLLASRWRSPPGSCRSCQPAHSGPAELAPYLGVAVPHVEQGPISAGATPAVGPTSPPWALCGGQAARHHAPRTAGTGHLIASIERRPDGRWRARYRDDAGREHARHFPRKIDAQRWLDGVTASVVRGDYIDPKAARITLRVFAGRWLAEQSFDPSTREAVAEHPRTYPGRRPGVYQPGEAASEP